MAHTTIQPPDAPPRAAKLLNDLRQTVLVGLSKTLRRAFAGVIDDLLERLLREASWQERQAIDDALDLLRNGRDGIESNFDRACAESWDERTRRSGRSPADAQPGGDVHGPVASGRSMPGSTPGTASGALAALSLVDDSAMGDQLLVGKIAGRSRRRMDEEQIDGLRARFGALLGRDWFADNDYPVAPDIVFEALRKSLALFGQARVVLFLLEVFEPRISADLSGLYADLNTRLIQAGVMPEIRYQIEKPSDGSSYGGSRTRDLPAPDASVERPSDGSAGAEKAINPGPSAAQAPEPDSFVSRVKVAVSGPDAGSPQAAVMAAATVTELVSQLDQRIHAAQGSATRYLSDPARFATAQATQEPATSRLLEALTTLQLRSPVAEQDTAALVSTARSVSKAVAREHGSPLERLIIETVSLVFEHVYEDEEIADTVKQQLLRLQVAAFKAALIDPSFFARPNHPMRRLIDRIAAIGSDPDFETSAGSALVNGVAELVGWVLANFERDLSTFEVALVRIDDIVEAETGRRTERLAKIAAAAQKAETLERARDKIREELATSCSEETPEFVCRFIALSWTEVVSRIATGADFAPFDVARARRTMDVLLWSIATKSAADIPTLAAELPQLIADLSRGLSFIALSGAERELFFSELLAWHGATIDDAKRGARTMVTAPAAVNGSPVIAPATRALPTPVVEAPEPAASIGGGGVGATSSESGNDEDAGAAAGERGDIDDAVQHLGLTNGTEVEVDGPSGACRRFKVGWMSPSRSVYIFSRYPRDHWTARRVMLNALLEQGRLRVVHKWSGTGRAIESLKAR